ncbi:MFS transporter [Planctellipticum variicoloris]|uniref:MFS transporter n=1 Tax=Planctellipticum variicoloris TaxID=3064265 RepID=UPI00301403DF|nr:MFS transporter [Planctomycetaceae bacterium SH412]
MQPSSGIATDAPPLRMDLRINLSIMMFLQFAVWGAWFVVLGNYLGHLKFSNTHIGTMYSLMPLGAIFSTLFVGQIADRYFSSERLMAILHLAGAGLLYAMAQVQNPDHYMMLIGLTFVYSLLYNPTLALSNSIAFSHIPSGERDFPGIRVLGTIGWIAVGLIVGQVLSTPGRPAYHTNLPLLLAAGLSAVLGLFSFALPHTPPTGKAGDAIPFIRALGLLKDPSFAVFFGVSFIITIVLAFYYSFTGKFLETGAGVKDVASTMSIGQFAEMLLLPFLPWFLKRFGMKSVLALGMLCWGVRYAMFAVGSPFALVIIGVALHGICFDFFFAAGFIHVDNTAPKEIRASGQALFSFLTYGVGMYLGSVLSGYVAEAYTNPETGVTDWRGFWMVPAAGVIASLLIFLAAFRMKPAVAAADLSADLAAEPAGLQ